MSRKKDRPLTPAERRSFLFVGATLLAGIGLGVWPHLSQHEFVPPREIAVRSGEDLSVPMAELSPGEGATIQN